MKLATAVLGYLERRQLIRAGERLQLEKAQKAMDDATNRAKRARASVDHSADSVSNDPNNRDNG